MIQKDDYWLELEEKSQPGGEELMQVKGIGESDAKRIVEYYGSKRNGARGAKKQAGSQGTK